MSIGKPSGDSIYLLFLVENRPSLSLISYMQIKDTTCYCMRSHKRRVFGYVISIDESNIRLITVKQDLSLSGQISQNIQH